MDEPLLSRQLAGVCWNFLMIRRSALWVWTISCLNFTLKTESRPMGPPKRSSTGWKKEGTFIPASERVRKDYAYVLLKEYKKYVNDLNGQAK